MRSLRALWVLLITATLGALGSICPALATASSTYDVPVLTRLDVDQDGRSTQPGHVNGSISTDAPYLEVRVEQVGGDVVHDGSYPYDARGIDFYVETWGYTEGPGRPRLQISARACAGIWSGCDPWVAFAPTVTVPDVVPDVTFPDDTAIDADDPYVVHVHDTAFGSGGQLYATWQGRNYYLAHPDGYTDLTDQVLADGVGQLRIVRCRYRGGPADSPCTDLGIARDLAVDRTVTSSGSVGSSTVGPQADRIGLTVTTSDPGDHVLDWRLVDDQGVVVGGRTEPVRRITGEGRTYSTHYDLPLPEHLSGSTYRIEGTVTRTTPLGDFASSLGGDLSFAVDATGPTVGAVTASGSRVYPVADDYLDTVTFTAHDQAEGWTPVTFEVLDDAGRVVLTASHRDTAPGESVFTWDGRTSDGDLAGEGQYRIRVTARDQFGNAGDPVLSSPVELSHQRLVTRVWRTSVTAADSQVASTVGRCSRISAPSRHGWVGSLGLLSGTRCQARRSSDLLVDSVHSVELPDVGTAPSRPDTVTVAAYGGSAVRGSDTATLRLLTPDQRPLAGRRLSPRVGYHLGATHHASDVLNSDRTIHWEVVAGNGRRYDVRNFVVTLVYSRLE